jgi:PhzF family phenazine biosynthesis protein
MSLSFTTLDVFTTTRYAGNPVSIIQVPASQNATLTQTLKQKIAREFNLSEIVFLHEPAATAATSEQDPTVAAGDVHIDIFTAIAEVPFAGHPTIGTANFLFQTLPHWGVKALVTKAGRIPITYNLPSPSPSPTPTPAPAPSTASTASAVGRATLSVPQAFHIHKTTVYSTVAGQDCPLVSIVKGMSFVLVPVRDVETLRSAATETLVRNTYEATEMLDEGWRAGIVGTYYYVYVPSASAGASASASSGNEAVVVVGLRTRMFGSREDPATGSAASALGCWIATTEASWDGVREVGFEITQGVEMGRESAIGLRVRKNAAGDGVEEVLLSGSAVPVMHGTVLVADEEG